MKIACSTFMMSGNTFEEQVSNAVRLGYDGVEVRLFETEEPEKKAKEAKKALDDAGISAANLILTGPTYRQPLGPGQILEDKSAHARRAIDISLELGCPVLLSPEYCAQIPLPLFDHPKRPTEQEHEVLIEYYSRAGKYAQEHGGKILVEPMNRYETHYFYTLSDAIKVIEEVGCSSIFVIADLFHMNMEEVDPCQSILEAGNHILHVQLGDSNRMLPGQGHMDFQAPINALKKIGYDKFISLECGVIGEREQALADCAAYLKRLIG